MSITQGQLDLNNLKGIQSALDTANYHINRLINDHGFECENAELDGQEPPALDEKDIKALKNIYYSTQEATGLLQIIMLRINNNAN